MSALREAVVLPALFLTVVLLAGFRGGPSVRLLPPPLVGLVLAVLLLGSLVRSGVVIPGRLCSANRTALENTTGAVVLVTLFLASAQALSLVIPESGLLNVLFVVFFAVQLLTTLAGPRDRLAMLRGLLVILGCAFVLRFVVLEALYSPDGGMLKRALTAAMKGVSLGALEYTSTGTVTGYVAFSALALYMIGLALIVPSTDGRFLPASTAIVNEVPR